MIDYRNQNLVGKLYGGKRNVDIGIYSAKQSIIQRGEAELW